MHCVNASLERWFSYLTQSSVHTALDPTIKLSFTDNTKPGKRFVFDSGIVKREIKQLLPEVDRQVNPQVSLPLTQPELTPAKKPRLLDFSSVLSIVCSTNSYGNCSNCCY